MLIGMSLYVCRQTIVDRQATLVCDSVLYPGRKYTRMAVSNDYMILTAETYQQSDSVWSVLVAKIDLRTMSREWESVSHPIDGYPLLLFQPRHITALLSNSIVIADIDRYRLSVYDEKMRRESESEMSIPGWIDHSVDMRRTVQKRRGVQVKSHLDSLRSFAYGTWSIRRIDALDDSLLLVTIQSPCRVEEGVMAGKPQLRYDVWAKRENVLVPVALDYRTPSPSEDEMVHLCREWPIGEGFTLLSGRIVLIEPSLTNAMLSGTYADMIRNVRKRLAEEDDPPGSLLLIKVDYPACDP